MHASRPQRDRRAWHFCQCYRARALGHAVFLLAREQGGGPVDQTKRSRNRNKSKVRARVEHMFGVIKRLWGFTLPWGGQERNTSLHCPSFVQPLHVSKAADCIGASAKVRTGSQDLMRELIRLQNRAQYLTPYSTWPWIVHSEFKRGRSQRHSLCVTFFSAGFFEP